MRRDARMLAAPLGRPMGLGEAWEVFRDLVRGGRGGRGGPRSGDLLEDADSPTRPVKRSAEGLHDARCLATAIFLRLGGLSFDALACAPT